ncbi:MAG TPA: hypothetical protein VMI10_07445 [Terriglobales bacterium]|nr:hypothetical protein [Terriglobales bacterium]
MENYASAYQGKSDGELTSLASEREQLTPEAQLALDGELTRRNLKPADYPRSRQVSDTVKELPPANPIPLNQSVRAGEFIAEVIDVYGRHFWFFFKLTLPAVALSWLVGVVSDVPVKAILRQVMQGRPDGRYGIYVFEGEIISLSRYLITWIVFSLLFGALCSATRTIESGATPSVHGSVDAVRARLRPLFRVSLLLCGITAVVICIGGLAERGLFWAVYRFNLHPPLTTLISYGIISAALLILSRFGLAIPAALLNCCSAWQSVFRSDELTESKWLILVALLAKSVIGGYLAGMSPFWLARLLNLQLPSRWILPLASVAAVSAVEPILFIGFTLLYLKTANSLPINMAQNAPRVQEQPA